MAKNMRKLKISPLIIPAKNIELSMNAAQMSSCRVLRKPQRKTFIQNLKLIVCNTIREKSAKMLDFTIKNSASHKICSQNPRKKPRTPVLAMRNTENHVIHSTNNKENSEKNKSQITVNSVFHDSPIKTKIKLRPTSAKTPDNFIPSNPISNHQNCSVIYTKQKSAFKNKKFN